jgi:hypothetical protein
VPVDRTLVRFFANPLNRRPGPVLFVLLSVLSFVFPAGAEEPGPMALGLNYPGASLRFHLNERYALEGRFQAESGVWAGGVRGYRYFSTLGRVHPFAGLEGDYLGFKENAAKGSGFAGIAFAGGEYFFARRLSAQLDMGAGWLGLKDDATSLTDGGLEFVVNVGVNLYFGKARGK